MILLVKHCIEFIFYVNSKYLGMIEERYLKLNLQGQMHFLKHHF